MNKKKMDPISINGGSTDPDTSPCPSPQALDSMVVPNISETGSYSPSTSTSSSVFTKLNDSAAVSDSSATTSTNTTTTSTRSNSLDSSSTYSAPIRRHTGGDCRWEAIRLANSRDSPIGLGHFRLLKRLGYGDIGSVYLVELRGTCAYFAMKVMDRASLVSRNKVLRSQTEREILGLLDHPFLPTLYSHFETDKFYCLVMEYCSGGNLHSLRQKQPNKYFTEQAARLVLVSFFVLIIHSVFNLIGEIHFQMVA